MRLIHIVVLGLMMACFTGAVIAVILLVQQDKQRSAVNVDVLCETLVEMTGKPCRLVAPPPVVDPR